MVKKMKALIKDNVVVDIVNFEFPVHPSLLWVDCDDSVKTTYIYENGTFYPPKGPSLDEVKQYELNFLNNAFDDATKNAHTMCSLGFEIDANETANRNIEGLTLVMSDTDTTMFCDYNNVFHEVTSGFSSNA